MRKGNKVRAIDFKGDVITFPSVKHAARWLHEKTNYSVAVCAYRVGRAIKLKKSFNDYSWQFDESAALLKNELEQNKDLISKTEIKKIFQINNEKTISSYIKEKLLPKVVADLDGETFFNRADLCSILGIKELPNEPFLTSKQIMQHFNLKHLNELVGYVRSYKIPHYCFKREKGVQRYFLLSEVEASMKMHVSRNTDIGFYLLRSELAKKFMKLAASLINVQDLTKDQLDFFITVFVEGKNPHLVYGGARQNRSRNLFVLYGKASSALDELIENSNKINDFSRANELYKEENAFLKDQLAKLSKAKGDSSLTAIKPLDLQSASARVQSFFRIAEIKSLYELSKTYSRDDVSKFRDMGKKTLDEMEELLKQSGLSWKNEPATQSEPDKKDPLAESVEQLKREVSELKQKMLLNEPFTS